MQILIEYNTLPVPGARHIDDISIDFEVGWEFQSLSWPLAKTFNSDFCRQVKYALY